MTDDAKPQAVPECKHGWTSCPTCHPEQFPGWPKPQPAQAVGDEVDASQASQVVSRDALLALMNTWRERGERCLRVAKSRGDAEGHWRYAKDDVFKSCAEELERLLFPHLAPNNVTRNEASNESSR
jgi:hypothetical protein